MMYLTDQHGEMRVLGISRDVLHVVTTLDLLTAEKVGRNQIRQLAQMTMSNLYCPIGLFADVSN